MPTAHETYEYIEFGQTTTYPSKRREDMQIYFPNLRRLVNAYDKKLNRREVELGGLLRAADECGDPTMRLARDIDIMITNREIPREQPYRLCWLYEILKTCAEYCPETIMILQPLWEYVAEKPLPAEMLEAGKRGVEWLRVGRFEEEEAMLKNEAKRDKERLERIKKQKDEKRAAGMIWWNIQNAKPHFFRWSEACHCLRPNEKSHLDLFFHRRVTLTIIQIVLVLWRFWGFGWSFGIFWEGFLATGFGQSHLDVFGFLAANNARHYPDCCSVFGQVFQDIGFVGVLIFFGGIVGVLIFFLEGIWEFGLF